jgi:hypothetical protein
MKSSCSKWPWPFHNDFGWPLSESHFIAYDGNNICLITCGFTSHLIIFHLHGDVTIAGEGLQNLACARRSGPLSRNESLSHHTYCAMGPRISRSHPKDRPIQSPFTTHKGMWKVYSNLDPHGSNSVWSNNSLPISWYTQTYRWVIFFTSQIYQWDAIFINLLYQWVDNLACHYINRRHLFQSISFDTR